MFSHTQIENLARDAASGNDRALDDLLTAVRPDVIRIATKFLPNQHDAEEAAQDALLAAANAIATFDGRSKFTTWLYRITANRAIDTYRRLRRDWERSGGVLPTDFPSERRTSVLAGNRIDLLEAASATDAKFTEPVLLRDLCGLSYAEIAIQMNLPEGTVASRISEGRQRLQRLLDRS